MSSVMRSVKNVTKGYSSVQVKVRNGTQFCGHPTAGNCSSRDSSEWKMLTA